MGQRAARGVRVGGGLVSALAVAVAVASTLSTGCDDTRGSFRPAAGVPEPERGGTLRLAMEAPETLDPALSSSVYDSLPINQLFDGLLDLDASLGLRPALAATWTLSADGTTYEFHLRPEARFHDGTPVTAEDVRYTLERLLRPDRAEPAMVAPYLRIIDGADEFVAGRSPTLDGVEAVDAHTVRIRLSQPYPMFLEVLTVDGLNIVPRHVIEQIGEAAFSSSPVGSGPFRLDGWHDDRLVLAATDDHFLGRSYLDRLEIRFWGAAEREDGARRFIDGEIDVLEPSQEDLDRLTSTGPWAMHRYQELSLSFLGFGTRLPPVDRVEVRQAIAHAIDRGRLVAQSDVVRREATGIIPPGMFAYSPAPKALEHDPVRARLLLKRAGYGPDRPVPPVVLYTTSGSAAADRLLASIGEDLAAVGIPLEVRRVSWPRLMGLIDHREAPAFLLAWIADMNDPDSFLRGLLDVDGSGNYFGFEDREAEEMLDVGLRELNPVERTRIYRELEGRVLSQAPLVPLYHSLGIVATRSGVHGVEPGPMGMANVEFEKVWIDSRERGRSLAEDAP